MSFLHAIFYKCLLCFLFFLANISCIFCRFTCCFKYVFSSCNLQLFSIMYFIFFVCDISSQTKCVSFTFLVFLYEISSIFLVLHYGTFWYMLFFFLAIVLQLFFKYWNVHHLDLLLLYLMFLVCLLFLQIWKLLYFSISLNAN